MRSVCLVIPDDALLEQHPSLYQALRRPSTIFGHACSGLPSLAGELSQRGPFLLERVGGDLVVLQVAAAWRRRCARRRRGRAPGGAGHLDEHGVDATPVLDVEVGVEQVAVAASKRTTSPSSMFSFWRSSGPSSLLLRSATASALGQRRARRGSGTREPEVARPWPTKSVSHFSSTIAPTLPSTTTATTPWVFSRSPRLGGLGQALLAQPLLGASRSPSVSSRAFLASIIPAPVAWRSACTSLAVNSALIRTPRWWWSARSGVTTASVSGAGEGRGQGQGRGSTGSRPADSASATARRRRAGVGAFSVLRPGSAATGSARAAFSTALAHPGRWPEQPRPRALAGAAQPVGEPRPARRRWRLPRRRCEPAPDRCRCRGGRDEAALLDGVGDDAPHQVAGSDGVVVARDYVLDDVGVAVGVDDGDDRDAQLVGLGDRDVFLVRVEHEHRVGEALHAADADRGCARACRVRANSSASFFGIASNSPSRAMRW